ncbi:homeobox protein knotted-1-like 3 isoform X2 [Physcomitrium patens]|uniref:homeobox protein knotted-1-like 3 isoform X2 n=1 Tax=Physcomitrium patens TaxID=3218 RepID=UPI000D1757E4|nr:homeobox protein knotted-1-like 3 isoform X1 [Physcomitrium patens]XP_024375369.1 homeobox protein knotted-1-like 3 isoform X1 [Physcomitrium patens]XP_024375370.1 homeobox protein knotted-1-like 3 isoform X1 [Physcomitrium patens]XP_024375371.1 homeobox protein knotted-1-like 3 isoform X1 [Physcomitrium patens]XP_024375372.1 homeobox protein knotted-1-like 3 isoform X1 [Physcomitrium patens]XP_024375373.1 homeobox protein knotted-1-like 3 isoform X1 [Physcomitrium patens]XP_024375374.1 ho|eukprot:XP_024375368.1 homeobox protein knotted-1-like 3 isoform X1 [Physcomitrella patens]
MMAFNNLSHDVSLQQFPELWESSRFSQRHDTLDADQHTQGFDDTQFPKEPLEPNTNLHQVAMEIQPNATIIGDESSRGRNPVVNESDDREDDNHLLGTEDGIVKNGRTWLNSALLREQNQASEDRSGYGDHNAAERWCPVCSASGSQSCMCGMPMHAGDSSTISFPNQSTYTHWLSMQGANMLASQHRTGGEVDAKAAGFTVSPQSTKMATELNLSPAGHGRDNHALFTDPRHSVAQGGSRYAEDYERTEHQTDWEGATQKMEWEQARDKFLIVAHPLYPDLLNAHASCLRVGTPVDQLPHIEAQLTQARHVTSKYSVLHPDHLEITEDEKTELDQFMAQYIMLLCSFKDHLQQHVYYDVTEAMMSCWELEQALHNLTGVSAGESTGATMSEEDEDYDSDYGAYDAHMDPQDSGGFGPLVPTESERTLMERVRQELKYELKQGYRARIVDVREEILRKRRAGKLPEGTTTVLKAWWQAHSKWPYPTEDEKERLIQETGLELKQVNNWFINQRKRNWHSNPLSSSSELKSKRKNW